MIGLAGNLATGLVPTLMFDQNALNGVPATVLSIDTTTLRNGNIDHFTVTKDVVSPYSDNKPEAWDNNTIMNAPFTNGSIAAGNADFFGSQVTSILVQRQRVYKDDANEWITIFEYNVAQGEIVNPENPLNFSINDRFTAYGETYRYRLLPVLVQDNTQFQAEGGISDPITAIFDGIFICDTETSERLFAEIEFGNMNVNQDIGVHMTLGNKYPIVVSNSAVSYRSGSVQGLILPEDFGKITAQIQEIYNITCLNDCQTVGAIDKFSGGTVLQRVGLNRSNMVTKREELEKFFTNKKPKIIKDWNGNMWLVIFTDNINISFNNEWGMGLSTIEAGWTEIGDPNNENDLKYAGMIGGNV